MARDREGSECINVYMCVCVNFAFFFFSLFLDFLIYLAEEQNILLELISVY